MEDLCRDCLLDLPRSTGGSGPAVVVPRPGWPGARGPTRRPWPARRPPPPGDLPAVDGRWCAPFHFLRELGLPAVRSNALLVACAVDDCLETFRGRLDGRGNALLGHLRCGRRTVAALGADVAHWDPCDAPAVRRITAMVIHGLLLGDCRSSTTVEGPTDRATQVDWSRCTGPADPGRCLCLGLSAQRCPALEAACPWCLSDILDRATRRWTLWLPDA